MDKFTAITDPIEIEELTRDKADLSVPFSVAPNGHLWVNSDELRAWRELRQLHRS